MEVNLKIAILERFNRRQQLEKWLLEDQQYQEQLTEKSIDNTVVVKKPSQIDRLEILTRWKIQDEICVQGILFHKNNQKKAQEMLDDIQKLKTIPFKKRKYVLESVSKDEETQSESKKTK